MGTSLISITLYPYTKTITAVIYLKKIKTPKKKILKKNRFLNQVTVITSRWYGQYIILFVYFSRTSFVVENFYYTITNNIILIIFIIIIQRSCTTVLSYRSYSV